MKMRLVLLTFSLLCILISCSEDNLVEVIEEVIDKEVEVIKGKGNFSYRLAGEQENVSNGYGASIDNVFYAIASDSLLCSPGGGIQGTLNSEEAFVLYLVTADGSNFRLNNAYFPRIVNGEQRTLVIPSDAYPLEQCGAETSILTIDSIANGFISGSVEGDSYDFVGGLSGDFECNPFEKVGKIKVEFSVPVISCD